MSIGAENLPLVDYWKARYNGLPQGFAFGQRVAKIIELCDLKPELIYKSGGPTTDTLAKVQKGEEIGRKPKDKLKTAFLKHFKELGLTAELYRAFLDWTFEGNKKTFQVGEVPSAGPPPTDPISDYRAFLNLALSGAATSEEAARLSGPLVAGMLQAKTEAAELESEWRTVATAIVAAENDGKPWIATKIENENSGLGQRVLDARARLATLAEAVVKLQRFQDPEYITHLQNRARLRRLVEIADKSGAPQEVAE